MARRKQGLARRDPNEEPLPRLRQAWRWIVHNRWIPLATFVVLWLAAGYSSDAALLRSVLTVGVLLVILARRTPRPSGPMDIAP